MNAFRRIKILTNSMHEVFETSEIKGRNMGRSGINF